MSEAADRADPARRRRRRLPRRDEIAERPLLVFSDIRPARDDVEERLLDLVAFDPDLVDQMNGLLDDLALVGIDHTRSSVYRAEQKTAAREHLAGRQDALTGWAAALPPDQALTEATKRVHALIGSTPKKETIDKVMAHLTGAINAAVQHRLDTGEPVEMLRSRIVELLRAQARSTTKSAVSRALNNTADKVRTLTLVE